MKHVKGIFLLNKFLSGSAAYLLSFEWITPSLKLMWLQSKSAMRRNNIHIMILTVDNTFCCFEYSFLQYRKVKLQGTLQFRKRFTPISINSKKCEIVNCEKRMRKRETLFIGNNKSTSRDRQRWHKAEIHQISWTTFCSF